MNPTSFSTSRMPEFVAPARVVPIPAPCHTYTNRQYRVPVEVWNGTAFAQSRAFLLDTGSDVCIVDYTFALNHRFHLDPACAIDISGLTGPTRAWLTKRYVRFPQLPTLRFSFHFLVPVPQSHPDHPQHDPAAPPPAHHPPLLGTADLLEAFELVLTAAGVGFYLRPGQGTPVGP